LSILREISNCGVSDPVMQICRCCHSKSEIPYREFPEFDARPVTQEPAVRYRQAERISQAAGQINAEGDGKAAAPGDEIIVDVFLVDQVVQKVSQLIRIWTSFPNVHSFFFITFEIASARSPASRSILSQSIYGTSMGSIEASRLKCWMKPMKASRECSTAWNSPLTR